MRRPAGFFAFFIFLNGVFCPSFEMAATTLPFPLSWATPKQARTTLSRIRKTKTFACLKKLTALASLATVTAGVTAPILNESNAIYQNMPHVGGAIFLDTERIENLLTYSERELLSHAGESAGANDEIALMFADKLKGDYEDSLCLWSKSLFHTIAPVPRYASEYFDGQSTKRGICRHKAMILNALLQHYKIESSLEIGNLHSPTSMWGDNHEWVRLADGPQHQKRLIDPTSSSPEITDAPTFYQSLDTRCVTPWPTSAARVGSLIR